MKRVRRARTTIVALLGMAGLLIGAAALSDRPPRSVGVSPSPAPAPANFSRQQGAQYSIRAATISTGGTLFSDGSFAVVGQAGIGAISNSDYTMHVGIVPVLAGVQLPPANTIIWDPATNPIPWPNNNPQATTRSLRFTVTGPAGPSKPEAIKVTMVDLQHPIPPNQPPQAPPNFTTFDMRLNGVCVGGTYIGHHCDTNADCPSSTCGSLVACTGDPVCTTPLTCTLPSNGCARWVGKLGTFLEYQGDGAAGGTFRAARLQCTPYYWDWKPEGLITVVGAEIAPSSQYSVQVYGASCMGVEAGCTAKSVAVTMYTRRSGDAGPNFNPPAATDQPDALDIAAVVNKLKSVPGALAEEITQMRPNLVELNADINALDIAAVVDGVKFVKYAFSGPCPCPSTVTCGITGCTSDSTCAGIYGAESTCVKTCVGGTNAGDPCINDTHCPPIGVGTCGAGFCRDRCGRCN